MAGLECMPRRIHPFFTMSQPQEDTGMMKQATIKTSTSLTRIAIIAGISCLALASPQAAQSDSIHLSRAAKTRILAVVLGAMEGTTMSRATQEAAAAGAAPVVTGEAANPVPEVAPVPHDAAVLMRAADALAKGEGGAPDLAKAFELYRQAAELGDRRGKRQAGQAMVLGRGTAVDVAGGLKLINEAADAGDSGAVLLLGDFYAQGLAGKDRRGAAIAFYTRAADLGRAVALVKLGDAYRNGRLVARDPLKAASYYRAAIAAGRKGAAVNLGRGLASGEFKGAGSPSEGIALLRKADSDNLPGAAVALSDCYLYGLGVTRSAKTAVAVLQNALQRGDTAAGLRLVSFYRDGRPKLITRNLQLARRTLAQIEDKLTPAERDVEHLLLTVSLARGRHGLARIGVAFAQVPESGRQSVVRKIRSINPNAYVYLVQSRLADLGYYGGNATGMMSKATARAVTRYCRERESVEVCNKGPMSGPVTDVTVSAF
jgi:TPR repeat protein